MQCGEPLAAILHHVLRLIWHTNRNCTELYGCRYRFVLIPAIGFEFLPAKIEKELLN